MSELCDEQTSRHARDDDAPGRDDAKLVTGSTALLCVVRWRRHPRQDDHDFRPLAGRAIESEPAAKAISNDAVNNMQAEAGASIATRCKERIECLPPDIEAHAAA